MEIRLAGEFTTESIVDGEGIRTVIWTQGCRHNCKECHNPDTHSFTGGFMKNVDELCQEIADIPFQDGITFSGGDPMEQIEECLEIAKFCDNIGLNIWCYTGYTMEYLLNRANDNEKLAQFLSYIDVLVDSPFIIDLKSYNVPFRGSSNQRIIDCKNSLKNKKVLLIPKYEN